MGTATTDGLLLIGLNQEDVTSVRTGARPLGLATHAAASLGEGLRSLTDGRWTATFLSLEHAGSDLDLAARLIEEARAGAVVLVVSAPTAQLAMEAMRLGAKEVLEPPLSAEAVTALLRSLATEAGRVALPALEASSSELVGSSPQLLEVFKVVGRVARSPATVLITGESGTGKELVARAIHGASDRVSSAFVAVNCAAIPEDLLESELFGHERGAFTGAVARKVGRFERADRGTLFLDEIGDMSLVLQAKILRALQEREIERLGGEERISVDVRIVAATHRDLALLIETGDFREDLFYRLAVVRLHLGPLRERGGDLRELALHYAAHFAAEYRRPIRYLSAAALTRLEEHPWPGNVRELRNVLERAVLVATGDTLGDEDVQLDQPRAPRRSGEALPGYQPSLPMADVEKLHLRRVLELVEGHLGKAADILGMHRNTVSRKAQEYGLVEER